MSTKRSYALRVVPLVFVLSGAAAASEAPQDADMQTFLRTADVVDMELLDMGVTLSHRATLSDGTRTARAVWKTIDVYRPIQRFDEGLPEIGFLDSYKSEIAAYELDKMLNLGFVPPTVERRIDRDPGSMQLWVEDCITEGERFQRQLQPPDKLAWSNQVYSIRLFRQLIYDADYKNASNILCDETFRLWSVDHSRAFRTQPKVLNTEFLRRFSRDLLERLRRLDHDQLERHLSRWLTKTQRKSLLARRDIILEHAEKVIAERGEKATLYP